MSGPITVTMARVVQTTQPVQIVPTDLPRRLAGYAAALLLQVILGLSTNAIAGKWTITPDISVKETYDDNASLAEAPTEGTYITEITPGIRIAGSGGRFKADMAYRATGIVYSNNSSENRIANFLNATATLEAIEKFFYIDAFGYIDQTYLSPFGARPANVTTITANRTESRTYGVSPYVQGNVGNAFTYQLRYRYSNYQTNNSALPYTQTDEWTGRAASPIGLFGWALDYDYSNISYNKYNIGDQFSRLYRAWVYYQPDPTLRLNVTGGWEENNYFALETRSNSTYGGGFSWKPTPLTSASYQYEYRYFGPSHHARLEHRTRLSVWTLSYSRDATTQQQSLLTLPPGNTAALLDAIFTSSIPDPVERQAAVEQFLQTRGIPAFISSPISFYTLRPRLEERGDASVGLLGKRSSVMLIAFGSKTQPFAAVCPSGVPDAICPAQGAPLWQSGFGVHATRQLTGSTTLGAGATRTYAHQDEPVVAKSRNDFYNVNLNKTLSPKTNIFAGLGYTKFVTEAPTTSSAQSRTVFAGLYHRF